MDTAAGASVEQAQQRVVGYPKRSNAHITGGTGLWAETRDASQATGLREMGVDSGANNASLTEPVFDLVNCGPRNRFVVRGVTGEYLIVHNCGFAYDESGETVAFDGADRIRVTKELIEESSAKVLVFVPYTGALEAVAAALREDYEVGIVQGSTSKHERDMVFSNFQNGGSMRVIVANPGTLSHGLTLTAADTIIWFGPINSNETYQQACARVRRPGQKRTTVIAHLTGTPLEDKAYTRLRNKQAMQGLLLDAIKVEAVANGY